MEPAPARSRRHVALVLGVVFLVVAFAIPNLLALRLRAARAEPAEKPASEHSSAAPPRPANDAPAGAA